MDRTSIGEFGKVIMPFEKTKKVSGYKNIYKSIIFSVLGYFCAGGNILIGINPMGLGYMSVFLRGTIEFYFISLMSIAGFVVSYSKINSPRYILYTVIMICLNTMLMVNKKTLNKTGRILLGCFCVAIAGLSFSIVNGMSLYLGIKTLLEVFMTGIFAIIFDKCRKLLDAGMRGTILSEEECICICILFASVLIGVTDIAFYGIHIKGVIAYLLIFILSYRGGIAIGVITGCLTGILLMIGGSANAETVCLLSLCAISGGTVNKLGRPVFVIVTMVSTFISCFYINSELLTREFAYTIISAEIIFLLIPNKIFRCINTFSCNEKSKKEMEYFIRMKEMTIRRLNDFANAFDHLSDIFQTKKDVNERNEILTATEKVKDNVCSKCGLIQYCWKRDLYSTYQSVVNYFGICSKRGGITVDDIGQAFMKRCININGFVNGVNRVYREEKSNRYWNSKMEENKKLLCQQLVATGKLISNLSIEVKNTFVYNETFEDMISTELGKNGIKCSQVRVECGPKKIYEVAIEGIEKYDNRIINDIIKITGEVIGKRFKFDRRQKVDANKKEVIYLVEKPMFSMVYAVSGIPKDGEKISGDSHTTKELSNGLFVMALADGMGSGVKAENESKVVIELIERFLDAGFEKDFAVKMVNSVMFIKSGEDNFSTLDICSVDLYSGNGEFIKTGATDAYIVRDKRAKAIYSSSLPVGILDNIEIEKIGFKLNDSDIIIMLTDGAADVIKRLGGSYWVEKTLEKINSKNPKDISDFILMKLKEIENGCAKDDMTVMAGVFWEQL